MRIDGPRIYLRDTRLEDLARRRHWELVETEWKDWDAPWEFAGLDQAGLEEESERYLSSLRRRLEYLDPRGTDHFRFGFEIVRQDNDEHIGWVNCYQLDDKYQWTPGNNVHGIAIGLVIPPLSQRGQGFGREAIEAYLSYFRSIGYREVYTQTWSGNHPMVHLAKKLGFEEVARQKNARRVRGQVYDGLTFVIALD